MLLEIYVGDAVVVDLSEKFKSDRREITIADLEAAGAALAPRRGFSSRPQFGKTRKFSPNGFR
jgi:hypothetical protein